MTWCILIALIVLNAILVWRANEKFSWLDSLLYFAGGLCFLMLGNPVMSLFGVVNILMSVGAAIHVLVNKVKELEN